MKSSSANHNKLLSILLVAAVTCFIIAFSLLTSIQSAEEISAIENDFKLTELQKKVPTFDMAQLEKEKTPVFDLSLLKAQVVSEDFSAENPAPSSEDIFATPPASNYLYTSEATADVITAERSLPDLTQHLPPNTQGLADAQGAPQLESPEDAIALDQSIRQLPTPAAADTKQEQVARSIQELQKANIAVPQEESEPKQQLASTGVALPLLILLVVIIAFAGHWVAKRYE